MKSLFLSLRTIVRSARTALAPAIVPALLILCVVAHPRTASAQTRIMPLGDSITHGGGGFCAYRYELWFELSSGGYNVDFVGRRNDTNSGDPTAAWYPNYLTTFDRDHEGYWGWRTDEIEAIVTAAATAGLPDIVLVHLGTNDIGQMGAAGVTNADANLRAIIGNLRTVVPNVTVLLAQVTPIGMGSSYFANEAQVGPLNSVIATIVTDSTTAQSPVILVDQNSGFDLGTMMQGDGLHPNLLGEAQMAAVWLDVLDSLLVPGNIPPNVTITAPGDGATFGAPASISIEADATDMDGNVTQVTFYRDSTSLGADTSAPFSIDWTNAPIGVHALTAIAEDDSGATRVSNAVTISVLPFTGGTPLTILNPSFEDPALAEAQLASGPGVIGGWTFTGTASTFTGIFNPPVGSYPAAGGNGTPDGADSTNAAFLFHNGGVGDSVSAEQLLGDTLTADSEYMLTVAIGRFLPDQPFVFSSYGGYSIELLAGTTVIAQSVDEIDPPTGAFRDAFAYVASHTVNPALIGMPLSIRLDISALDAPRSTHFDNLRLVRRLIPTGVQTSDADADITDAGSENGSEAHHSLLRASPNPFNPATTITFSVPRSGPVTLAIYDLRGQLVERLIDGAFRSAGTHQLHYRPQTPSGIYFLRFTTGNHNEVARITLLK